MGATSTLTAAMQKILERTGTQIRVQYFTSTIGSVWDDDVTWAQSGTDHWTSGVVLPITQGNSSDSILLEQGKIILDDKKLFVHGSLVFTGSEMSVSIRIGSPAGAIDKQYSMLDFNRRVDISNVPIYRQIYIRTIGGTGSSLGVS